ncbi:filamentous hemagglutinin N-terminal domain-containing protein [Oxalobacteraceae bacterium CAVE-383]|nr:filamentous hemagglutinin N-terminal domain-containing protein [Oxalobacteraceae bacterium CAVE-383]
MKTSSISSAARAASAISLSPAKSGVKADPAPQLKSVTVYFRGRKMVLMQRPQRRLSLLLCRMLRRSMLNLLGRLPAKLAAPLVVPMKRVLSAGALCAMALASATTAHATAVTDTTLPTDYSVKYGQVGVSTTGNQMNVNIGTDKAIINWNSFSIGSQAGVDFHFNSATASSSVLNRVTGNDPSQIMGSLTSNGKVFLINAAGILVGKTAKIDVAGFTASTLNLHNTDFLNDKLSFNGNPASTAGVVIEQDGSIKTRDGGSVYLIGANVENNGVIMSPGGEVLLAAGSSVDLVDTGTPGVKINVKAGQGKVTNLGKIIAETGTIGFGAALINNGGVVSASSVTKEGGRIFLRASQDLTTTETSSINADGTVGGNVVLYADGAADIGGDVSAMGNVDGKGGAGGYVDTSGKQQLAVRYAPRISAGGEWHIDPNDVDIVTDYTGGPLGKIEDLVDGIFSWGSHSEIKSSTITDKLNSGVSVSIVTGAIGSAGNDNGDITVHSNIVTSSPTGPATLSLNAARNINILDNVTISDGGQANGLRLEMVAGYTQPGGVITPDHSGAIQASNATINVGGGFAAHAATYGMSGGSLTSSGPFTMDAALSTSGGADIIANNTVGATTFGAVALNDGSTITLNGGTVALGATALDSTSTLTVQGAAQATLNGAISGTGILNLGANGADTATLNAGSNAIAVNALHQKAGTLSGTNALTVNGTVDQTGGSISFHDVSLTQNSGTLTIGNVTATDVLNLTAANGPVKQKANTHLAAAVLNASATSGIILANATNTAATFTASNSASGNITYAGTGNLALGQIDNAGRDVTISTASGSISQTDTMAGGNVSVSATTGITLDNTSNGIAALTASNTGTGAITVTSSQALTLNDVSTHDGNIAITSTTNDIQLSGNLSTGATANSITLNAGAGIVQNNGTIATNKLTASAHLDNNLDSVGNNIRSYSGTSDTGNISLSNTGTLATFGNTTVSSTPTNDIKFNYIDLTTTGNLTVGGRIDGGTINLTSGGDIAVNGTVNAAGTASLNANGAITQTAGITAAALNAMAGTGITLNNSGNSVGSLTASNNTSGNIAFTNGSSQSLTLGHINNDHGDVTVVASGDVTASDTIFAGGKVDLTSTGALNVGSESTITAGTINLTSQAAGGNENINIGGQLTATDHGAVTLNSAHGITEKANNNSEGNAIGNITADSLDATAVNDIGLNGKGVNNIGTFTAHSDAGSVALGNKGDLTVKNVSAAQGVNISTTGKLTVDSDAAVSGTSIVLASSAGFHTLAETEGGEGGEGGNNNQPVNADMAINGQLTATGDISLTSDGAITQDAVTGSIGGHTLTASAGNDITLSAAANHITGLDVTAYNGNVTVSSSGSFFVALTNYGGSANITSSDGSITLNDISASDLTLNAKSGSVAQSMFHELNADTLAVNARDGINLNVTCSTVSVGNFSAANTGNGNVDLLNHSSDDNVLTLSKISNVNGNVTIQNNQAIEQARGSNTGISALVLDVTTTGTTGGITLDAASNSVGAFKAQNAGSGDIVLNNASTNLLLNGTIYNHVAGGNVSITNTGNITGTSNVVQEGQSPPVITNETFADNNVTLTSTTGNVTLAKIIAQNLAVNATQGKIDSVTGQVSLQISDTMTAAAKSGITLNGNTNATVINHIANFDGTNSGAGASGDITLFNQSTGDGVNNLVQITNSGGNIFVDNTGAMKTTGQINASHGSVALATHSPLTIGAGGINAVTGVTLTAGNGLGASDTVVVNGVIANVIGAPAITGAHVTMNAVVVGPAPVFAGLNPPDFGPGYVVQPINVAPATVTLPPVVTTTTVDQNVASTSNTVNNVSDTTTTPVTTTTQPNTLNSASNQTAGGGDGEFGGSKDDGKGGKGEKSSKPLPICS